ncbi:hypothetical protein Tco_1325103, partial [Tanacetum coccineum]
DAKEPVSKRKDAWNSGNKDRRRSGKQEDSKALVTIDGEGVDWTSHSEEEDYALMACNSSGSDTEVISCSKECKESYAELKKLYDKQRAQKKDVNTKRKVYTVVRACGVQMILMLLNMDVYAANCSNKEVSTAFITC